MTVRWDPDDPDVAYVPSSKAGMVYRIDNAHSLTPRCTCQAGRWGRDCRHVAEVMEAQEGENVPRKKLSPTLRQRLDVSKQEELGLEEEPTKALAVRRPSVASRVVAARDALAATRLGIDSAITIALHLKPMWGDELAKKPEEEAVKTASLIVMTAAELGVSPIQAFSYVTAIRGKPFLMARMITALVNSRVPGGYITILKRTPVAVTGRAHRPGRPDIEITITMEDARKAKWTERNSNYAQNPAAMLTARVTTTLGWSHFSDVLSGMDVYSDQGEEQYAGDVEFVHAEFIEGEATEVEPDRSIATSVTTGTATVLETRLEPTPEQNADLDEAVSYTILGEEIDEGADDLLDAEDVWAAAYTILGEVAVALGLNEPFKSSHMNAALGLKAKTQKELKEKVYQWWISTDTPENELTIALHDKYAAPKD